MTAMSHSVPAAPGAADAAQPATVALFVSDLHLQPSMPRTAQAFLDFLAGPARRAQQLYLLGDLFEAWAGDDDIDTPFHRRIVEALRAVAEAGVALFWIAGNRDFLVGPQFAAAAGLTLLPDPHPVAIGDRQLVLSHGDLLCTDDRRYMAFRAEVRQPQWQRQFLALPLARRKEIVAELRDGSRAEQRMKSADIMDANEAAVAKMFDASGATVMIHGHTHRPARHEYPHAGGRRLRYVLPDWDCDTEPGRGGWLALQTDGALRGFDAAGRPLP